MFELQNNLKMSTVVSPEVVPRLLRLVV